MKHLKKIVLVFLTMSVLAFSSVAPVKPSYACDSCSLRAGGASVVQWGVTQLHVLSEFFSLQTFIVLVFWEQNVLPALMMMTDQLTAVGLQQVMIIGTFLDAKHQLETERLLQTIQARAHKDYYPSVGLCQFGSSIKSLAASERKSDFNAVVLSQRSMDRQLGNANTSATYGGLLDKQNRLDQFKDKFCDGTDNNDGLWLMCHGAVSASEAPGASPQQIERYNKDIDYARTVDHPWTLEVDFTDSGSPTNQEEEIMALAANLYTHDVFPRIDAKQLQNRIDPTTKKPRIDMSNIQKKYLDMRSIVAKRSVAENSFNAITAMKSEGTTGSKEFLDALLEELGVPAEEINGLVGDKPSYYAQMEVLTKKIYQNPDFYTNLYDKPANVSRKEVALQAIGLMQKFDMFKSYLRSEASLSVLLELAVINLQDEIENEINDLTGQSGSGG